MVQVCNQNQGMKHNILSSPSPRLQPIIMNEEWEGTNQTLEPAAIHSGKGPSKGVK